MASTEWMTGHDGGVNALSVSPDGTQAASASEDGTVRVWDLASKRARRCVDCFNREEVGEVAWAGAEKLVIAHGQRLVVVDLTAHGDAVLIKAPNSVYEVGSEIQCLATTAAVTAFGGEDGSVYLFRHEAGNMTQVTPHENVVSAVAVTEGEGGAVQVWSVAMDCTFCITDFAGDEPVEKKIELPGLQLTGPQVVNPPLPTSLSVCAATRRAAVGVLNGTAWVFDEDMEPEAVWQPEDNVPIEAVCWAGEDKVWTAGRNGYMALWDLAQGEEEEAEEEEEEEEEDAASPPKVLTAVRCPDAVTCLARLPGNAAATPPYHILAGDVKGTIGVHKLLSIDALEATGAP